MNAAYYNEIDPFAAQWLGELIKMPKLYHWRLTPEEMFMASMATVGPVLYAPRSRLALVYRELETALDFLSDGNRWRAARTKLKRSADSSDEWPNVISVRLSGKDFIRIYKNLRQVRGSRIGWQSEAARSAATRLRAARLELFNSKKA